MAGEEVGEDLGVAAAAEGFPFPLKAATQRAVIIDLAVERDDDAAIRGTHRLTPGLREIEDRQPDV